jgi:cobalt/nickel transport system permease protein
MLAFLGHGGITVIGLNTLLLGAESMLGHLFFYLLSSRLSVFRRSFLATFLSLLTVSVLLIGIVAISHTDVGVFTHLHGHEGEEGEGHGETGGASIMTFAVMVLSLGAVGWLIEGAITGAVIRFIARVKPDLLAHVLHARPSAKEVRSTP